ncbi:hypothetical protein OJ996_05700 [Luteolibacter sp. GHJ8]|uniref:PEP-CTERM sorting domain-containing protein n=1 Tax=Luteolibacter rhizosphaerae TaxID=2989719 RepID=A0ABT3G1E1_9BACT|nr:hypothetical protein [Luteolibacter rhizosphaerae]MCW1913055.1 hypothetical protein [Luteolibacter rhizosphaerae]
MQLLLPALAVLGSFLTSPVHAAVLAGWNFETNTPAGVAGSAGPIVGAEIGSGSLSGFHASGASVWETQVGNGSFNALGADMWTAGDYYQFSTSSVGYKDITVSFDQIGTGRSPRDWRFSVSLNGAEFFNFGSPYSIQQHAPGNLWNPTTPRSSGISFDLSAIGALDNATTIYFRLTQVGTASVTTGMEVDASGFDRIDNVIISGIAVPESSAALLGALGAAGLFRRRRA